MYSSFFKVQEHFGKVHLTSSCVTSSAENSYPTGNQTLMEKKRERKYRNFNKTLYHLEICVDAIIRMFRHRRKGYLLLVQTFNTRWLSLSVSTVKCCSVIFAKGGDKVTSLFCSCSTTETHISGGPVLLESIVSRLCFVVLWTSYFQ